jgi:hypothetical protein
LGAGAGAGAGFGAGAALGGHVQPTMTTINETHNANLNKFFIKHLSFLKKSFFLFRREDT